MKFTTRILLLSATRYSITDEQTKKTTEGVSLHYCAQSDEAPRDDSKGMNPVKNSVPLSEWGSLVAVPGWYDCDMRISTEQVVKRGEKSSVQVIKPTALQYIGAVSVGAPATPAGVSGAAAAVGLGGAAK